MAYLSLVFWLCAAGAAGEDLQSCDRIALPWYGSFWGCQIEAQQEIAAWMRRAHREEDRLRRWRCTIEPVPQTFG